MVDQIAIPSGAILEERFEIVRELGHGGMGTVFEATHSLTGKRVAVKLMNRPVDAADSGTRRAVREAQALGKLSHPSIVGVQAVGLWNDRIYFAMDFAEGKTLEEEMKSKGPLSVARAMTIGAQICDALVHAHGQSIVHRDLKPSNIILESTADGDHVKIVDFGIAGFLDSDDEGRITQTGAVIGSPLYMSPEQCRGARPDQRSDLYSLGCIIYEMLSGKPPFEGNTPYEILSRQLEEKPKVIPGIPKSVTGVLDCVLAKVPDDRYQTAAELKRDLDLLSIGKEPIRESAADSWGRTKTSLVGVGSILFIVFLVVGGSLFWNKQPNHTEIDQGSTATAPAEDALQARLSNVDRHYNNIQVEKMGEEAEISDFLFSGQHCKPTLPEHSQAAALMSQPEIALNMDQYEEIKKRRAIRMLEKALHSERFRALEPQEQAMIYQRLALYETTLLRHTSGRKLKDAIYKQSMAHMNRSAEIQASLDPRWRTSWPAHLNYGFIEFNYYDATSDKGALSRATQRYRAVYDELTKAAESRKSDALLHSAKQLAIFRLTKLQTLKQDNFRSGSPVVREYKSFENFQRNFLAMDNYYNTDLPMHEQAIAKLRYGIAKQTPFDERAPSLEAAVTLLTGALAHPAASKLDKDEIALMRQHLGIAQTQLFPYIEDPERQKGLYEQSLENQKTAARLFSDTHPGYSSSYEPMMRLGDVYHKYGELNLDLPAYKAAAQCFTQAEEILREAGTAGQLSLSDRERKQEKQNAEQRHAKMLRKAERLQWVKSLPKN